MTGRDAPALHLVVELEGPVRPEFWVMSTFGEARLLAELEHRRDTLADELTCTLDNAIELLRRRVAGYQPGDVLPLGPA